MLALLYHKIGKIILNLPIKEKFISHSDKPNLYNLPWNIKLSTLLSICQMIIWDKNKYVHVSSIDEKYLKIMIDSLWILSFNKFNTQNYFFYTVLKKRTLTPFPVVKWFSIKIVEISKFNKYKLIFHISFWCFPYKKYLNVVFWLVKFNQTQKSCNRYLESEWMKKINSFSSSWSTSIFISPEKMDKKTIL